MPMLTGMITASTSGNGQCMMPIATKVTMATSGIAIERRFANKGCAIFATVAIIKPAAAEAMPVSMRRSAGNRRNGCRSRR